MMSEDPSGPALVRAVRSGDRRALARVLSIVEEQGARFQAIAPDLLPGDVGSNVIGITGAPGAGKSTLTDALIGEARERGERIAVVAVDPSSPLHGGAILGDRVRISQRHSGDPDVFVRSMASRGHLGGLSRAVPAVVRTLHAAGWVNVLLETVGVGQSEVEIAASADTTLVVVNPGWGDEVQANKAGLLEIADVLVVNKADRPGAGTTVADLKRMLHFGSEQAWTPPVVLSTAIEEGGATDVWNAISEHRQFLVESGELVRRRRDRRISEALERARSSMASAFEEVCASEGGLGVLRAVGDDELDPVRAATLLLEQVVGSIGSRNPLT